MEMWKESQLKQLSFAREIETAYPILLRFTQNIGFNFCAVSLTSINRNADFKTLRINNYPQDWNQLYEKERYRTVDPIVTHCNRSMLPVVWSEEFFSHTPQLWEAQQQHGLRYGWSQSFHHEATGLCSTLSLARKHDPLSPLELYEHSGYMLYAISHLSDLFVRTLPKPQKNPEHPHLSPRELEVLKLSALGKTAYEIARILCLSERTVNYHVQNVIIKLKVCNKISAVIAASRCGLLDAPNP
ncbi:autoinducer binding domain-containing protein [Pseudomonas sp. MG-9]|uniref:Autoinducer binding domain-containing protein n=1 Tax=Pseudomonas serboccidentalis TaxID=2964670 RepID=A0ABY7ZI82_9PSED|nr:MULTISPECIES: autoinducer binding domain-containing protein [Pseudomonas]MBT9267352.1 autoinducer binding domain-containing protein [Pseudomonas sp. MG-9]WDR38498.1 autoinducer binding domain-containing protein [Pseudomonas serboccidentalis]